MVEFVPLLGTIAVLLTMIGSYRLFGFFFDGDPIFAGLSAAAVTISFLIVLDVLLLILGIAVLVGPVFVFVYYSDAIGLSSPDLSSLFDDSNDDTAAECSNCGVANSVTNRHCENCGELL